MHYNMLDNLHTKMWQEEFSNDSASANTWGNPGRFGTDDAQACSGLGRSVLGSWGRKVKGGEWAVKVGSYSYFQVFGDILNFFVD